MKAPLLSTKKVNKYFRNPVFFHALKDIDMQLEHGEFASIMGKSGCGKSTLLYILSTMDTDYDGSLFFRGEQINQKTQEELAKIRGEHIGFVFQFHYLLPEFTVLDNVMLPGLKLGKKTKEEVEHDAITKLNLLGMENQAIKRASLLSGGQKQRVSIARALINNPTLIMGDEPTGNLDSKNSNNVLDIFRTLNAEQNLSLLVVTHDNDFAAKTDRIIEMGDGRII